VHWGRKSDTETDLLPADSHPSAPFPREEFKSMLSILAHITPTEVPSMWLAAFVGFVAGVAVTFAFLARRLK
jgi:hypothetical protein